MRRDITFKTASIAGASDLTILAPIKKGLVPALDAITYKTRVKRVLRLLHLGRTISHEYEIGRVLSDAVERVGKIHSIRIAILEPEDKVLLVVTFDGAWESYIRVIWQKVSRLLDLIFCNTEGYKLGWESTFDEWCAWLRSAQAETMFLYSQPNLTNTDTHYLQSIERIHRRESDLNAASKAISKFTVPSAEENAKSILGSGIDLTNWVPRRISPTVSASVPAFRQGLKTLVALYRLSDAYMPKVGDGAILHRAAQELLSEFKEMVQDEGSFEDKIEDARKYYADAWDWFKAPQDYERTIPALPPSQDDLFQKMDVQGGIVKAYEDVSDGCLLLIAFETASGMGKFLNRFKPTSIEGQEALQAADIAQNIAVTIEGLRRAGYGDDEIAAMPEEFVQGMDKRQGILGDLYVNHPRRWRLPVLNWAKGVKAGDEPSDSLEPRIQLSSVHAVIQLRRRSVASKDDPKTLLLERLTNILGKTDNQGAFENGAIPLSLQWMCRLKKDGKPIEHFGFTEAESNPVYALAGPLPPKFDNQIHIGEVLHGYPNAADEKNPANGAKSDDAKNLLKNGSFLVIRKLRQNVQLLNKVVAQHSKEANLAPERVLAKMMGRWPAGAIDAGKVVGGEPLVPTGVLVPAGSNDFNFRMDDEGAACPFHAHIRRANPRSDNQGSGGLGERQPRIVRRGMLYGEHHVELADPDKNTESLNQERGLVFMAYNASIGEQFEVIQRWITGGNSTGSYSGQSDPFLGVAAPGRPRVFQYLLNDQVQRIALDGSDEVHVEPDPLVRLEWGMYLFTPSISSLETLALKASAKTQPPAMEWSVARGELLITDLQALEKEIGADEATQAWKAALEDPDAALDFKAASIWAAIRKNYGGVLDTPYGVLVASQSLADQVLLDTAKNLTAEEYLPRMKRSFGELYLGMDAGRRDRAYENESVAANMEALQLGQNSDKTCAIAEKVVLDAIDEYVKDARQIAEDTGEQQWQTTIDIRDLIEKVIAHFCEEWFGLKNDGAFFKKGGMNWLNPTDTGVPRYPGHFMAPSRYVFQPNPSDTVRDVAAIHGAALNKSMSKYLTAHRDELVISHPLVKAILEKGNELNDRDYAPRTILGLMMGFVPTTDGLMRRIAGEWLREGTLWSLRAKFAVETSRQWTDTAVASSFERAFQHAFLLRAAPELLWRTAITEHQIGSCQHAVTVPPGKKVVVGQISATHEGLENGGHRAFEEAYLYAFGDNRKTDTAPKPTHACPGRSAAMAVMQGFLRGLVTCKQPMRIGQGSLSFVVERNVSPTQRSRSHTRTYEWTKKPLDTGQTNSDMGPAIALFAFGDSWVFQPDLTGLKKPFFNLCSSLKKKGYSFVASSADYPRENAAKKVFNYAGAKLAELPAKAIELKKRLDDLKPEHRDFKAVLMSAGGNDIAAYEKITIEVIEGGIKVFRKVPDYTSSNLFKILNQGATSIDAAFNQKAKCSFFDDLKKNYIATLSMLLDATNVPILIHGYDHPNPNGVGVDVGIYKAGPWLQPVFELKYIGNDLALAVMRKLITDLNDLIKEVVGSTADFSDSKIKRLHYVKLTEVLEKQPGYSDPPDGYRKYWRNELHAEEPGFDALAQEVIDKLGKIAIANADTDIAAIPAVCPFR
jgi:hypothetical protein